MIAGVKADTSSIEFVAGRLRELRKRHGLTQQELAEVADTSEKFLQQVESCRKKQIWLSTVGLFAKAFGLQVHEFLSPIFPENTQLAKKVNRSRIHK